MIYIITNLYPTESHPYYGTFVKDISDEMSAQNISTRVIFLRKRKSTILKLVAYFSFYVKAIFVYLTSKKNDEFFVHYISHSSFPIILGSFFRKRNIVANVHGSDLLKNDSWGFFYYINNKIIEKSKFVVVPSRYYKEKVYSKFKCMKEKIVISPSGGIDFYEIKKSVFPKKNVILKENFIFGCFGRLTEDKGIFTLLQAISMINKDSYNVSFIFIGPLDKRVEEKFYKKIEQINFKVTVKPGMPHDALMKEYPKLDAFIFPSKRESESLGLVGIEAMAYGVPVIGSDIGGIKSYVRDNHNGYIFQKGNSESLKKIIERFLSLSPAKRLDLSKNCISTSLEYDRKNVVKKLLLNCFDTSSEI